MTDDDKLLYLLMHQLWVMEALHYDTDLTLHEQATLFTGNTSYMSVQLPSHERWQQTWTKQ